MSVNPIFVRRDHGDAAVAVGGRTGSPESAARVLLQTADGNVLVHSIRRMWEGMFAGNVYACMPGQRGVKMGDTVAFEEAQIFKYVIEREEDVTAADMASKFTFEAVAEPVDAGIWALQPDVDCPQAPPTVAPVAAVPPAAVPAVAPPAVAAPAPAAAAPIMLDEPTDLLEEERETPSRDRKDGESESREEKPVVPETVRKCIECGSVLPRQHVEAAPEQPPAAHKVACAICGRINST